MTWQELLNEGRKTIIEKRCTGGKIKCMVFIFGLF